MNNKKRYGSPRREQKTAVFNAVKGAPYSKGTYGMPAEKEEVNINRRKSDKRFWARLVSITVIVPMYITLLVFADLLPRSTVSNIEKRNLATFPEFSWNDYWSGQYTADVANYCDDTVPFRDTLKQAASYFNSIFGIKYNDVQVSGTMEVVNPKPKDGDKEGASSAAASVCVSSSCVSSGTSVTEGTSAASSVTGVSSAWISSAWISSAGAASFTVSS